MLEASLINNPKKVVINWDLYYNNEINILRHISLFWLEELEVESEGAYDSGGHPQPWDDTSRYAYVGFV